MNIETCDAPPLPLARTGTFALVDLRSGRVHPLRPGPNSIGRSVRSDVVLADAAVSRRHAVVMIHEEGNCDVGDAQSRNGVRVNGQRVRIVSALHVGDLLQIGNFRLLFTDNGERDRPTIVGDDTLGSPNLLSDETLGIVTWHAKDACWHFVVPIGTDRIVPAIYTPSDPTPPPLTTGVACLWSPDWKVVRECFRQVKARESEVRTLLTKQDPSGHLYLGQVLFTPTNVTLVYERSPGSQAACVTLDPAGEVVSGPMWIGECENGEE